MKPRTSLRLLAVPAFAFFSCFAPAGALPPSVVDLVYTVRFETTDEGLIETGDDTEPDAPFQFGGAPLAANRRMELADGGQGPVVDWGRRRQVETSMLVRCTPTLFPPNWGGAAVCSYAWVRFHTEGRGPRARRYFAIEVQHAQEYTYDFDDGEEGTAETSSSPQGFDFPGDGGDDGGDFGGPWKDYLGLPVRLISLNPTGSRVAEEFWGVDGTAVRRAPFRGAPVRWMAPRLSTTWRWLDTDWESGAQPATPDTPVPGFVSTCINEFRVSPTQTRRHAGKDLDTVVESIREELLGRGWIEADLDLPVLGEPGETDVSSN
jgi:hypothetical protein